MVLVQNKDAKDAVTGNIKDMVSVQNNDNDKWQWQMTNDSDSDNN